MSKQRIIKLTEEQLKKIVNEALLEQGGSFLDTIKNSFSDTTSAKTTAAKININPKNLKYGDGGPKSPQLKNDVAALQQKLISLNLLKTDSGKPTGYFGPKTKAALDSYNGVTTPTTNGGGFIMIWAFPEYQPKVDGKSGIAQFFGSLIRFTSGGGKEGTYGKLGHGGCIVVKPNGDSTCFEFGRYPGVKEGYGKVLTHPLGRIAKIANGTVSNPEQVAMAARKKTYPPGPSMRMTVAVVKLPNPQASINYASVKQREYTSLDFKAGKAANCGTFARDVAHAGGIQVGDFCWPTPISVVNSFKNQSDKFFEV